MRLEPGRVIEPRGSGSTSGVRMQEMAGANGAAQSRPPTGEQDGRQAVISTSPLREINNLTEVVGPAKLDLRSELSRGCGLSANENQPIESGCGDQALASK